MTSASRADWNISPLPEQQISLAVDRQFTSAEMDRIRRGFISSDMDDRWFIFFEDNVLYLHRSWTGHCIYAADFTETGVDYGIDRLRVNRDPDQYRSSSDAQDVAVFLGLVNTLLLS